MEDNTTDRIDYDSLFAALDELAKEPDLQKPKMFSVVLHNDASTTPMIVVHTLVEHVGISPEEAVQVMFEAHTAGKATCGVFTKELAEHKVERAMNCSAAGGTELTYTLEAVE